MSNVINTSITKWSTFIFMIIMITGCVTNKSMPTQSAEIIPELNVEYIDVEFRSFQSDSIKYIGKYVKMKCSFSGPLMDLVLIDYPLDKFLPAVVGAPVAPFYSMNPMRSSLGHQNIVIPFYVAEKNPILENMQNLYLYGKVLELRIKTPTGEDITQVGIEATKIEPMKGFSQ